MKRTLLISIVVLAGLAGVGGAAATSSVTPQAGVMIEFWNGASWTQQASPGLEGYPALTAVTALSPTDAWAVGSYGVGGQDGKALAEHWDGSSWRQVPMPIPAGANEVHLNGLAAESPSDIWAQSVPGPASSPVRRRATRPSR